MNELSTTTLVTYNVLLVYGDEQLAIIIHYTINFKILVVCSQNADKVICPKKMIPASHLVVNGSRAPSAKMSAGVRSSYYTSTIASSSSYNQPYLNSHTIINEDSTSS